MILGKNNLLNHNVNIVDWIDQNAIEFFQTKNNMTKKEIIENISSFIIFNPNMATIDFAVNDSVYLKDINKDCIEYEENILIAKCICNILNGNVHLSSAINLANEMIKKYDKNSNIVTSVYYTVGNIIVAYDEDENNQETMNVTIPILYHLDIVVDNKKEWSWDDYKKQSCKNKKNE